MQPRGKWFPTVVVSLAIALGGCKDNGGGAESDGWSPEPHISITQTRTFAAAIPTATPLIRKPLPVAEHTRRAHDYRVFQAELPIIPPPALENTEIYYGKYDALQGEALYVLEVPDGWDGDGLIMWARSYAGDGDILTLPEPPAPWRQAVVSAGYAWAASSYSANFYDARAGLEDTNKLALNVITYVERDSGARLSVPNQYLISGTGMGGHVAAAAVDRENTERTKFKVAYEGAAPFCQSDQNQFQWLGDYTRLMMELGGYGDEDYSKFPELVGEFQNVGAVPSLVRFGPMVDALFFRQPPGEPKWLQPTGFGGHPLINIAEYLTGGQRPVFTLGAMSVYQDVVMSTGGGDGTINGILAGNFYGNENQFYRFSGTPGKTMEELIFNAGVSRVSADPDANPLRNDGVRWIPLVNGDFDVPVLTMHTLGDFYVPFRHQQLYRERAIASGSDDLLVQRAIRAPGHCDFSPGEYQMALTDWLQWVNHGIKPTGDDVLTPEIVADFNYGCAYTIGQRPMVGVCPAP